MNKSAVERGLVYITFGIPILAFAHPVRIEKRAIRSTMNFRKPIYLVPGRSDGEMGH
jgi:hypothetical protein